METRNIEFPIRLTDANDRTWLLKDPLSELVECLEDSHGLASYHCRFALAGQHDTSNRAIIEGYYESYMLICYHEHELMCNRSP